MTKVAEKSGRPNDIIASMFVPAAISIAAICRIFASARAFCARTLINGFSATQ